MKATPVVQKLFIVLLIWGTLAAVYQTSVWRDLEYAGFDMLTIWTAPLAADLPIVIVGIDEPSFADFRQQWPWPRHYHASLVNALNRSGAAVIAFDIVFADPSDQNNDTGFATAIKQAGNVILAGDMVLQQRDQFRMHMRIDPLHLFQDAGSLTGISSITPDNDMIVRKIPRFSEAFWRVVLETYYQKTAPGTTTVSSLPANARVKYLGPDHFFNYVSYYQALDPENMLPPDIFKNKIVLIGFDIKASAQPGASRSDAFASSFMRKTGWLTPGVEIHATFIANALLNRHILVLSPVTVLVVTALALGISLAGMSPWSPFRSTVTLALMIGALGLLSWLLFSRYDTWLPVAGALTAPIILYMVQGAVALVHERQRRIEIRNAFQHYVPPQVVTEIIRHPEQLKLGGTYREITLMFTDLKSFTTISEKLTPAEVAAFLNTYFTQMTRIILKYGGTVDKFIGDAIMAFWGAPMEDPEQALHAVQAATDMQEATSFMHYHLADEQPLPVHMRIGIHSGKAIVGNMGSVDRFDYSALGDTVNLASRLEGVCKQYNCGILVSESTAKQLAGRMPLMYVDRVVVKGRSASIDIFTPLNDPDILKLSAAAVQAFHERNWDESEQLWQQLRTHDRVSGIADNYLDRIRSFRQYPPPDDWDKSVILDKKL